MQPLDQATINRYQPGGDIYNKLVQQVGQAGADSIAYAASTGDRTILGNAIENAKNIPAASTASTASIFLDQLYNDPLSAPIQQLDTVLTNAEATAAKATGIQTLMVLGLVAVGIYIFWPKIKKAGGR